MLNRNILLCLLLLVNAMGVGAQNESITDTTKLSYNPFFIPMDYYRVNYSYQSVEPDGQTPVTLSAAMVFPKEVFEHQKQITVGGQDYDASGLLLSSHYTMTTNSEAPTQTSSMSVEAPLATFGLSMIIICPDGYGLGLTADRPQAYLMADATARHNIDAVKAARRLLSSMGYSYGELFAQIGYSQGGHSAMATQRYIDTWGGDAEGISHIDYTLCGGGPYDIGAMLDSLLLPDARYMYPCALPLIFHGQVAGSGIDVSYSDIFCEPLDAMVTEWLDAKTYTTDELNDKIYEVIGGNSSTGVLVKDMLHTDYLAQTEGAPQQLRESLQENSLAGGWRPNDHTRFYLYHSEDDEVVPFYCMEHLEQFLSSECLLDEDRLEVYASSGAHSDAAAMFVVNSNSKLKNMEEEYLEGRWVPTTLTSPIANRQLPSSVESGWFNLQGQRLPGRPHAAGLYIHNGRKVVVGSMR